ncbi:MAG: glycerophosphodiester phosphodiesterase [Caldicoprobacterales bacterium]|nr:glycerophosphodiester phosphodiesterase [Clostridiales bacterium]
MKKPVIYAHRGASAYAPENTEAAFCMAMEMQAGGIELDVHLSRDGKVVVCHDERVDRVSNGTGLVRDMTLEELKKLDFGSWFGDEFRDERIMTLDEFLKLVEGWDGILNIEIKSGVILYEGIEDRIVDALRRFDRIDTSIISSFNHYSLLAIKKLEPALKIGLLYAAGLVEPWEYARRIGAEAIHPLFYSAAPPIITGCRENGILLNAWTVDEPEYIRMLALGGVDGIITNVPDTAREITSQL